MTLQAVNKSIFVDGQLQLACVDDNQQVVGCIDLYNYDPINQRVEVGIVVEKSRRHQGQGTLILQELDRFCAEHFHIHQIYCDVLESNTVSCALFQKAGYTLCGTFSQWVLTQNGYQTVLRFQKIVKGNGQ